jgi:hypothetical protein
MMTLDQAIRILFDCTQHNVRSKEAFNVAYEEFVRVNRVNEQLAHSLDDSVKVIEKLLAEREESKNERD